MESQTAPFYSTMNSSDDSFRPITFQQEDSTSFTHPELLYITSGARLYRARKSGKFFMLKTPKENSALYVDLLHREYELSIGLSHPHIIQIYTYEPDSCVGPCIVMEYVSGRNLADFLQERPSLSKRIRIFEQLLEAVACMHKADVIHNDLKPQNIIITLTDDDVKLIDFGLSDKSAYYLNKQLGGSPKYVSPELLQQDAGTDARSDIYSIGHLMSDLFGHRYARIRRKCLQHDRERRYQDIEKLQKAWNRRKLPLHIAIVLFFCTLILVPSILYTYERMYRRELESSSLQQKKHYDSVTLSLKNQTISLKNQTVTLKNQIAHEQKVRQNLQESIDRKKKMIDSLIRDFDLQAAHIIHQMKQDLKTVPYTDFHLGIKTSASKQLWNLKEKYTSISNNPEINGPVSSYIDKYNMTVMNQAFNEKEDPTLNNLSAAYTEHQISKEELNFYLELIQKQLPYRPYPGRPANKNTAPAAN